MPHDKKKQSTGSWKGNRDKHQNLSKGEKEKKRQHDGWIQRPGKKSKESKKKGWCFLTTACVVSRGLPDNCKELNVLRKFRDEFISSLPNGKQLIQEYYMFAPVIVERIMKDPDEKRVWQFIYREIEKSVVFIETGQDKKAFNCYSAMFLKLKKKYIKHHEKVYLEV